MDQIGRDRNMPNNCRPPAPPAPPPASMHFPSEHLTFAEREFGARGRRPAGPSRAVQWQGSAADTGSRKPWNPFFRCGAERRPCSSLPKSQCFVDTHQQPRVLNSPKLYPASSRGPSSEIPLIPTKPLDATRTHRRDIDSDDER